MLSISNSILNILGDPEGPITFAITNKIAFQTTYFNLRQHSLANDAPDLTEMQVIDKNVRIILAAKF